MNQDISIAQLIGHAFDPESLLGLPMFIVGIWSGRKVWQAKSSLARYEPGGQSSLVLLVAFGIASRFIGDNAFGLFGSGLLLGFLGRVLTNLRDVAASDIRDSDWLLDGRQLRPMRSVIAGFSSRSPDPERVTAPLWMRPKEKYSLWIELGPSVTGPDEASDNTPSLTTSKTFKVALFTFRDGLKIEGDEDVKVFDMKADEVRTGALNSGASQVRVSNRELEFAVVAPARWGKCKIRCNVYFNDALVQSQLVYAQVLGFPRFMEKLASSLLTQHSIRARKRRDLPSSIDFSLSRALDPQQLDELEAPRLSLILNANGDGTHSLRMLGSNFKRDAVFDGMELQDFVNELRGALRKTAWGNEQPWVEDLPYKYPNLDIARLEKDLLLLAVRGYRFFDAIIDKFEDPESVNRLQDLMRAPGRVEIALKQSASLALPAAMIYDYPLDTNGTDLKVCGTFRKNLSIPNLNLSDTDCFRGACPNVDDLSTVCPGGFWGFRHSLGMPLSVAKGTTAPLLLSCPSGPQLAVAVSTDPQFLMRSQHEVVLKTLVAAKNWHYADTRSRALDLMKATQAQVVYFYCHGGFSRSLPFLSVGAPGEMGITRDNLRASKVLWTDPRPIVFINGCHTTALEPKSAIEFVSGFVQTSKASGVIGTEITIFEPLASAFAEDFFRRFFQHHDEVGDAVRGARLTLLKAGNPLGLVYIPYVVPSLKLAPTPSDAEAAAL